MGDKMRELLTAKRRRGWYLALMLVLAVLVTAGVGGLFHQPAVAKTYQVTALTCSAEAPVGPGYAGYFVHTHNEDCFDENENLVCPLPEIKAHVHDETCYTTTSVQTCGLAESDGHQHSEACYTRVRGDLICGKSTEPVLDEAGNVLEEGHVHTDECFAWTEELTCGMETGEGAHHHNESCFEYATNLSCDKPEIILHVHSEDCFQKNEDGSIYEDEDGNTFLICGMTEVTEHVHGPECFTTYELDDEENPIFFTTETAAEETDAASDAESTEGDESGLVFLFPEEEEEEEQPAESANPETETGDTDVTDDGNADPADGNTPDTDETVDTEGTENTELADGVEPNAEGGTQEAASGETAPIAEEPHEVIYTGTRGAERSGVTVLAEIPEGALDENAQLVLADADESAARKQILQVVNENAAEGEEREISSMLLLDIGFVSGGEPAAVNGLDPIRVTIKAAAIRSMSAPKLFHLSDRTAREVKDVLFDAEAGTAVFTGITFSPFAVVDLTGEDPAEEAAEETVSVLMPAQSFTGETESVVVSVEAPEGAFPEGTTMVVSPVEMDDDTLSNVTGAVESSGEQKLVTAQAVDISFFDADGNLIEPKLPIKVSMKSALVSESENVALVHLTEENSAETSENEKSETPAAPTAEVVTDVQVVENPDEHNEIQFESDAFSVYVLVGTETITTNYITADGETYTITVTYGPEAMIPAGATLAVAEIPQDSEEYAAYLAQAQSAVKAGAAAGGTEAATEPAEAAEEAAETPEEAPAETEIAVETENTANTGGTTDRVTVTTARFFDITILDAEGNPVEPAAPVDVKIEYMEPAETAENYQVVHFGAETEVLNPAVSGTDGTASAFDFQASFFSVYGVVGMKIITMQYITADGETYIITVTYGPEAGIPEGAELVAREISSDEDMYRDYWDAAEENLQDENDAAGISDARFFDVSIVSEGQKIEPKTAVEVKITQDEPVRLSEDGALCIVHFAAEGIEVIEDLAVNEMATEITYMQNGFSVIGEVSVTNSSGWPVVNGKYVLVFQDTANSKYYALGKDKSLREVKVAGETIVFLGEGTTDVSYLEDYAWYLMGSGGDGRTRAYLSTEYYQGSGDAAQGGTYIDFNDNSGFSNSARQLYFSTDKNMIYSRYYYNEYTFSVSNGILSRVTTSDSNASPILFAQVDGFIANSSESDKFTQIDVDSLVTKFQRQMTQELITDKTAKVEDYSNRIYKIEIGASSGYYEISPSIHLEFVVDASRSMFFPTSLDQAGTLNGNSRSNLETWLSTNGNTNQTYFVIADPNGSATVYTIFRRNGAWYYVDASNYNPPDGEVYEGSKLNTWSVSNLDGYIYTTDITGSSSTDQGIRYKWVSRIEYLKQAVKAAAQVIYAVDTNAELGLVTFNSKTYDKGTFTNDQAQLFYEALEQISLAGGTNQRDGLQKAIDKFNADTQRNDHQCIALLITDGAPNWKENSKQVSNSDAWTAIGQKASTLKALADGDGTAELFCLGLSLENVGTNKSSLFGVSSGTGYNYNAEDAAAIVDCITQIVKNVVLQANLVGQVKDVIDSAFYPVTSDGTPLADGDWITLNGEKAGNKDAAGQVKYDSSSDIWTVEWKDQEFDWPPKDSAGNIIGTGWKGVLYVKTKESSAPMMGGF